MPANTNPDPIRQDSASPLTVQRWSGREIRLLREAMRLSLRDFAAQLGVSERSISKWEAGGGTFHPRPANQQILDVAFARADTSVQQRFVRFVAQEKTTPPQASAVASAGPGGELDARQLALEPAVRLESGGTAAEATAACRQVLQGAALDDEVPSGEALFAAAAAVRREIEDTLARGTISPTRLDRLEDLAANHIRIYTTTPPAYALANLLVDFMDLQRLAA